MRFYSIVLALIIVSLISGAAMAFSDTATVEFNVTVDKWIQVEMPDSVSLNVKDGTASGTVMAVGKILSNTPLKFDIKTTRVAEEWEINNWFWYKFFTGTTSRGGGNPGVGFGGYSLKAGETDFEAQLEVRSTHSTTQGGKRQWYQLPAGEYKTILSLTFYAPVD